MATRLRSLQVELDRLDDSIDLVDGGSLGSLAGIIRIAVDLLEADIETGAAGR